ncbi:MAG TPA: ribonuclease HI family protein, partial [Candidatus Methylomirabilis sp.]|nr:ribonuclease HI family protein [Candidatus Methylomirabilis sp.]
LRRLSHALPAAGVLHLPSGLSATEAMQTICAALKALEPPTPAGEERVGSPGATQIHIDGAARGNPGPAGVGILITGPDGQVVERIHRSIGEATNNVAEYRALLLALERARALGCAEIEVYSDSELLVRQLQGRYQVKHPALRALHTKARGRIAGFRHFHITHVPREENTEADALATRGIEEAARPALRGAKSGPRAPRSGGGG